MKRRETYRFRRIWFVIFCLWLVTACNPETLPISTETIVPTKTTLPTITKTVAPTLTNTPTTTKTALNTQTPEPTLDAELWGASSYSMDGAWVANIYKSDENGQSYLTLTAEKLDGSAEWLVEKIPLAADMYNREFPVPVHWSKAGEFFYFTRQGFMDGCFTYVEGGQGLSRFHLAEGKVEVITNEFASEMSLSPDETFLAYVQHGHSGLRLLDIASGAEIELAQFYPAETHTDQYGIIWSPDSSKLAYSILLDACISDKATTIVVVDVPQQTQRIVINEDPRNLYTIEWLDENTIFLRDWYDGVWHFNVETELLTKIKD